MFDETSQQRRRFHELGAVLARLAEQNVYLGTSSWKYPGWCGQLYDRDQYLWRSKFSQSRFEKNCLAEYATVFKSVCVDAGYYRFPTEGYIGGLVAQVPPDFLFSFKVTDEITIRKFTRLPRFGKRAGKPNENFLDADLFQNAFLRPCAPFRKNIGLVMFEFSHFYKSNFARGRDFVEALDGFLEKLPAGWQYGVEIRNEHFLEPEYFDCLARHGVAHIYNSWQRMPPVSAQLAIEGSRTNPRFTGARFLLKPGRPYQEAVDAFSPYNETKEVDEDARDAGSRMIKELIESAAEPSFLFINNRLEGNALNTITGMLEKAGLL